MNTIDSSLYLQNQTQFKSPSSNLGKDDFMKILMTQLQNQDPLNPMEDKEFISQMAEFSSMEQMIGMSESMAELAQNQIMSPIIQYSHMIGQTVSYKANEAGTSEFQETVTSQVKAVSQQDNQALLELENGDKIYAEAIIRVGKPNNNS